VDLVLALLHALKTANNALGITVYRQTQRQDTAALLAICQLVAAPQSCWRSRKFLGSWKF